MNKMTLTLNSPITEEQWDAITDVDFEHTNEITFHTKHDKEVKFVKASAQPERKKMKWIPHREISREYIGTVLVNVNYDYWFCDACGYRVENGQPMYNFCPNCGGRYEG